MYSLNHVEYVYIECCTCPTFQQMLKELQFIDYKSCKQICLWKSPSFLNSNLPPIHAYIHTYLHIYYIHIYVCLSLARCHIFLFFFSLLHFSHVCIKLYRIVLFLFLFWLYLHLLDGLILHNIFWRCWKYYNFNDIYLFI